MFTGSVLDTILVVCLFNILTRILRTYNPTSNNINTSSSPTMINYDTFCHSYSCEV